MNPSKAGFRSVANAPPPVVFNVPANTRTDLMSVVIVLSYAMNIPGYSITVPAFYMIIPAIRVGDEREPISLERVLRTISICECAWPRQPGP